MFSVIQAQIIAVYLLIVCFLNIGYQTENWQLTTCSFFMLQYPLTEMCPPVNIFRCQDILEKHSAAFSLDAA